MIAPGARNLFPLDPRVVYLDHGGFGVTPKTVARARLKHRDRIERNPKAFFAYRWPEAYATTVGAVARRFALAPENVAMIENATEGVNAVLRSLILGPGDEILLTSQTYGAVAIAAQEIAARAGAKVTRAALAFPLRGPCDYAEAVARALNPRTRLAILDHIASPTALVTPVAEMAGECRRRGVPVLVDGAHAPGQIPLDIASLGVDWYAGNLHKWSFVPRACGFLWASDARRAQTGPALVSWNAGAEYSARFNWTGTRDVSQILTAPDAFAFFDSFGEGAVMRHNRDLLREAVGLLRAAWEVDDETPDDMRGAMATLRLPDGLPFEPTPEGGEALQKTLILERGISAAVTLADAGALYIRIAAQIYNAPDDYLRLAEAVLSLRR